MLRNAAANNRPPIRNHGNAAEPPVFNPETAALGVRIPPRHKPQRALTSEECQRIFGVPDAIKMNFIPQMLGTIVLDQTTRLVNYCRDHRIAELKKHTRLLKTAVEEYTQRLADAYGREAFKAYTHYVRRYHEGIAGKVWLMETYADTLCANQLPEVAHREVAARVLVILMLIAFIRDHDRKTGTLITGKTGILCSQRPDSYQEIIRAVCQSIGEDFGYKLIPDKTMQDWTTNLSNEAWWLAERLIGEEGLK